MIEPRAWEIEDSNGVAIARLARHIDINRVVAVKKTPLTTVSDVLADLRKAITYPDGSITRVIILEFLDAWEKENAK